MLKNISQKKMENNLKIAFWGTPQISVYILDSLKEAGILPYLIITSPDKPKGRKLLLTPPEVKIWSQKNNVKFTQPQKIKNNDDLEKTLKKENFDFFVVIAYGKILPKSIIDIPKYGTLNIHPSLLPELRGPSPIISAILEDKKETGVSIMLMDEQMDHGPIVLQKKYSVNQWPQEEILEKELAKIGGQMLIESFDIVKQGRKPKEQEHSKATYCKKIEKTDGLINLQDDPYLNFRKIRSFHRWPRAYFFDKNGKRVIITKANFEKGDLEIEKVIPEGKKEVDYNVYLSSINK